MVDIINITSTSQFNQLIKENSVVLVDFWATWCVPCKFFGSNILPQVAKSVDDVAILKVNTDENQELSIQYAISSVPTLIIFKNGDVVEKMAGVQQKQDLINKLEEIKK